MKRIIILVFVLIFFIYNNLVSDSPRIAIIEESTNASSVFSADDHPEYYSFISGYFDKVIPIVYHIGDPGENDPMYLENPGLMDYCTWYSNMFGSRDFCFNGKINGQLFNVKLVLESEINKMLTEDSPYEIQLSGQKFGDSMKVRINILSSINRDSLLVKIVIMEDSLKFNPGEAGTNGETVFNWVPRAMMPNPEGEPFSVEANKLIAFEGKFKYNTNWNKDNVYIVAYIQDQNTKEIYQAAKTERGIFGIKAVSNSFYNNIKSDVERNFGFKFTHENKIPLTVSYEIDKSKSYIPNNWDVSITPSIPLTLNPYIEKNVTIKINPKGYEGYARIGVKILQQSNFIGIDTVYYFYFGTEGIENIVVDAEENLSKHSLIQNVKHNQKTAFLPYKENDLKILESAIYKTLVLNYNIEPAINDSIIPDKKYESVIENAITDKKNLILLSENILKYKTSSLDFTGNLIDSVLKIIPKGEDTLRCESDNNGKIEKYIKFPMNGFGYTPEFMNVIADINDAPIYGEHVEKTDLIKTKNYSESVPLFFYDNNQDNIGGVRNYSTDSKIIFSTFNFEAISNLSNKNKVWDACLEWMKNGIKPKGAMISFEIDTLDLGSVSIKESSSKLLLLSNTGELPLYIDSIIITGTPQNAFRIDSVNYPLTTMPFSNTLIHITFKPTEKIEYVSSAEIKSNAVNPEDIKIFLKGTGTGSSGVSDIDYNVNFYPNPAKEILKIDIKNINNHDGIIEIEVVDILGKKIKSEKINGTQNQNYMIDITDLIDGIYLLILKSEGRTMTNYFMVQK